MAILVVDDSADSRNLIKAFLQRSGNEVVTACSAAAAFDILGLGNSDVNKAIDLVLMDITMPDINGIQACREIRRHGDYDDVPIIMVTASSDYVDLEESFAAGAVDYVTKPLNFAELQARVRSVLRLKREIDARKAQHQELLQVLRELEEANRQLEEMTRSDGLTGVANRRCFDDVLEAEWKRAIREGSPLSLVMFDIDYFKLFNDSYGHFAGDDCLKRVAAVVRKSVKRTSDLVARYGGEEFALILPNTTAEGAIIVGEKVCKIVEDLGIPHVSSKVCPHVTVSVGCTSCVPVAVMNPGLIIATADKALYFSKQQGRNQVSFCETDGLRGSLQCQNLRSIKGSQCVNETLATVSSLDRQAANGREQ